MDSGSAASCLYRRLRLAGLHAPMAVVVCLVLSLALVGPLTGRGAAQADPSDVTAATPVDEATLTVEPTAIGTELPEPIETPDAAPTESGGECDCECGQTAGLGTLAESAGAAVPRLGLVTGSLAALAQRDPKDIKCAARFFMTFPTNGKPGNNGTILAQEVTGRFEWGFLDGCTFKGTVDTGINSKRNYVVVARDIEVTCPANGNLKRKLSTIKLNFRFEFPGGRNVLDTFIVDVGRWNFVRNTGTGDLAGNTRSGLVEAGRFSTGGGGTEIFALFYGIN